MIPIWSLAEHWRYLLTSQKLLLLQQPIAGIMYTKLIPAPIPQATMNTRAQNNGWSTNNV